MKRAAFVLAALLMASPAFAQYTYATIDYPGASATRLIGFNDNFEIVGHYQLPGGVRHAMRTLNGTLVPLDPDGPLGTYPSSATQINNRGDITGWYQVGATERHGFVIRDGIFTTVDYPGVSYTQANGITDNGVVFGYFIGADGVAHGFSMKDDVFTQFDCPDALDTLPYYINARGDIVGNWETDPYVVGHGFLLTNGGEWYSFDAPGARPNSTLAIGIDDRRQILGEFLDASGAYRGFVLDARDLARGDPAFTVFDLPTPKGSPETMNNSGAFVGYYNDGKVVHGYVATPVRGDLK